MKSLLAAWRFLTIFPCPGTWGTAEADLARSVAWFPLVGLALGALAAAVAWGLGRLNVPSMLAALGIVVALMTFSGCLHLDGLSDTADGMLSSRPAERILEIMRDSHAGPMGIIALLVVVLAKFAALASMPAEARWRAALLMPLAGRFAIVLHMALLRYVRPSGTAGVFCGRSHTLAALGAALLLALVAGGLFGLGGLIVAAVCLAAALLLAVYVYRKIGGMTGDTLGAACEIVEAVAAVAVCVAVSNPSVSR